MSGLLRLLTYVKPHWKLLVLVVLAMVASAFLEVSPAVLVRRIVDTALETKNVALAARLSTGFVAIAIGRAIVNYTQWYFSELVGQKVVYEIRQSIHDHLQELPPSYFSGMGTGQVMSRLTSDVEAVQDFLCWGALLLTQMVVTMTVVTGFLFRINWRLTLATLVTFPFMVRMVFWFDRNVRPAWKNVRERIGRLTENLQENISGIRVVKAFSREGHETTKFGSMNRAHYEANMERALIESKAQPVLDFLSGISPIVVLGYGGHLVLSGRMTVGDVMAFHVLIWSLIWPTRMLGWLVNYAEQALAASPRLFELLDSEPSIKNAPDPVILDRVKGHIVFRNVSFAFPGDTKETLHDINLEIFPGERVAIVGGTGSGKSTLMNLLPRFLDPTSGQIILDGIDLRHIDLKSLRSHMGVVLQDNFLFSATVRENIALGKANASTEDVEKAARLAQAMPFIEELPMGLETPVGERGIGLSGGQRQRIALARALLMDPRVLILDEATSSVDTETEYLIQEGLDEIMTGRTCLLIAKRLSTIRGADRIVIMDRGRIVQIGTHQDLLSQPGFYRNLFESQFAQEDVQRALSLEMDSSSQSTENASLEGV
ncbi:MAG: ABC transporter ATP-binding protein [Bacillota bacterium]|jgi:ATP-binding cassette subfamily B multidrug efflux pump